MRRIGQCLNTKLVEICQRADQLGAFNAQLYDYLPALLHPHCHAGSFSKGCLTIVAHDPVWASQLRYCIPELRDKLRREAGIYQLTSIKITVSVEETTRPVKKINTPALSLKAREAIVDSGNQCAYLPLKEALLHLGSCKSHTKL